MSLRRTPTHYSFARHWSCFMVSPSSSLVPLPSLLSTWHQSPQAALTRLLCLASPQQTQPEQLPRARSRLGNQSASSRGWGRPKEREEWRMRGGEWEPRLNPDPGSDIKLPGEARLLPGKLVSSSVPRFSRAWITVPLAQRVWGARVAYETSDRLNRWW